MVLKQRPPARSHPRERTDQATKPRSHFGGNAAPEVNPHDPPPFLSMWLDHLHIIKRKVNR